MFATVLFDLDGTLVDPRVGIVRCFRHALAALDLPAPADDAALEALIGPPLQECFSALGVPEGAIDAAVTAYRERYSPVGLYEATLHPGVAGLLERLAHEGVTVAVATSKAAVFATRVVEHFGLAPWVSAVEGPTLDGRRRHKHEAIAAALRSCPPGPAVMVGDRHHDVEGARRCGLRAVGVTWGFGSRDELSAAGAWRVVDDVAALSGALAER